MKTLLRNFKVVKIKENEYKINNVSHNTLVNVLDLLLQENKKIRFKYNNVWLSMFTEGCPDFTTETTESTCNAGIILENDHGRITRHVCSLTPGFALLGKKCKFDCESALVLSIVLKERAKNRVIIEINNGKPKLIKEVFI